MDAVTTEKVSAPERHVVFRLSNARYALEAERVVEMQGLGALEPHPHGSELVRGVASVRGALVPVIDTRKRMGLPAAGGAARELSGELDTRVREHAEWFEKCVQKLGEARPIPPAWDGWLAQRRSRAPELGALLDRVRETQKRIVTELAEMQALAERGEDAEVRVKLSIVRARDLTELNGLFGRLRAHADASVREIVLYVEVAGRWRGLVVDAVEAVLPLSERRDEDFDDERSRYVKSIARAPGRDGGIFVLDLEALLRGG